MWYLIIWGVFFLYVTLFTDDGEFGPFSGFAIMLKSGVAFIVALIATIIVLIFN